MSAPQGESQATAQELQEPQEIEGENPYDPKEQETDGIPFVHEQLETWTPQVIDGVELPYGYEAWADGVYRVDVRRIKDEDGDPRSDGIFVIVRPSIFHPLRVIKGGRYGRARLTSRPVWIAETGQTLDTDEALVKLCYYAPEGGKKEVWTPRGDITDARRLTKLGATLLPITNQNVQNLVPYFTAAEEHVRRNTKIKQVGHRTGYYSTPKGNGWLIGSNWIGPAGSKIDPDPRESPAFLDSFNPKGNADEWRFTANAIWEAGWRTRFLLATSFAAPLVSLLNGRTFIVHAWAKSRSSKTALMKFAQAAWGRPDTEPLFASMNRTEVSVTEVFRHLDNLPVAFDERQAATINLRQFIYALCLETGRSRGSRSGGLRQDKTTWKTLIRTTGEEPLISTTDLGGEATRCLQIYGSDLTEATGKRLHQAAGAHYGHAGSEFLRKLVRYVNGGNDLKDGYTKIQKAIADRRGGPDHASPYDDYAAIIAFAQFLAGRWVLHRDKEGLFGQAIDDAVAALNMAAKEAKDDFADRALDFLRSHYTANPAAYADEVVSRPGPKPVGARHDADRSQLQRSVVAFRGKQELLFVPSAVNFLLDREGFSPRRVWSDFAERKWLAVQPGEGEGGQSGHATTQRRILGVKQRLYAIPWHVFNDSPVREVQAEDVYEGEPESADALIDQLATESTARPVLRSVPAGPAADADFDAVEYQHRQEG